MVIRSHILDKPAEEDADIINNTFQPTTQIPEIMRIESKAKSPSLNPETPPLMTIKSHVIEKTPNENTDRIEDTLQFTTEIPEIMKTESKVDQPMSIKSKILFAPKPAESIEIIMEKIRKDSKNKVELSQASQPTIAPESKPDKTRKEKETKDPAQQKAFVKPEKNDVIKIMKKIELMKEKETKSHQSNNDEEEVLTKTSRLENTQTTTVPAGRY